MSEQCVRGRGRAKNRRKNTLAGQQPLLLQRVVLERHNGLVLLEAVCNGLNALLVK